MKNTYYFLCALLMLCLFSCQNKGSNGSDGSGSSVKTNYSVAKISAKYAEGFKVNYKDKVCYLDIHDPQKDAAHSYHFALIPRGTSKKGIPSDYTIIETPVRKVICMTSLQLSSFIALGDLSPVVGINSTHHLFNQEMKKRLAEGKTQKIGIEGNFDTEVITGINPDLILISPFKRGGFDALKEVNIPLVPHLGYQEMSPLGQAEWIKVVGLLLGKEDKANEVFSGIEKRYNDLKAKAADVKTRPVVFSGEMRGGNWYAVGGKSFLAQLFKDAGADYFLKDDEHAGGFNLDFEAVYDQAANSDYWRIVNSHHGKFSYDALKQEDARYADFKAFRKKQVIYCNMTERPFYESMPMEPDEVLADLIKIFHPELLSDHQAKYYDLLK